MGAELQRDFRQSKIPEKIVRHLLVCLGLLMLATTVFLQADEETARIYIKKAREHLQKKNHEAALNNFSKAAQEAPEMPEVYYERGMMYRDAKESGEAMVDFAKAVELLNSLSDPSNTQKELQRKISNYQADYSKIQDELAEINRKYANKFLELAKKYQDTGDDYLVSIFNILQAIDPQNQEVREQSKIMKGASLAQKKSQMESLFNGEDINDWVGPPDVWTVRDSMIAGVSMPNGMTSLLKHTGVFKENYTVAVKMKLEEMDSDFSAGLAIISGPEKMYMILIKQKALMLVGSAAVLRSGQRGVEAKIMATKGIPAETNLEDWNQLSFKVAGDSIVCYFNDVPLLDMRLSEEAQTKFQGSPGLVIQGTKAYFKEISYLSE
ncbi:MAG: family 16 glycoside hydrolase [Candidatus Brocadiia bacterium]